MSLRATPPGLAILAALLVTALLYLPGLDGPWLLDDFFNLAPFLHSAPGQAPYHDIIHNSPAGPLGRPLALASFAANHATGLFATPALKATNLLLHLACGGLLFLLLRALLRQRPLATGPAPEWLAALLTAWWLLLPLHLSSVLYIVQRMTLLASLFSLAALLAWVHARTALPRAPGRAAAFAAAAAAAVAAALFSKESAAVTLAWLILIELFFFQPGRARPLATALVVAVAALLVLLTLFPPPRLAASYLSRDFGPGERLLSQARALWAYAHAIFLPDGRLGVFHDDFAVSRSWLSPATTLPAVLGLVAVTALALRAAASPRWWPASFGLLFFLAGHLVESTLVSLELYFEHRNYLPAAGLLLAAATATLNLWPWGGRRLAALAAAYLVLLAASTGLRATTWGDEGRLLASAARHHPLSARAHDAYLEHLVGRGLAADAMSIGAAFAQRHPPEALSTTLHLVSIHCRTGVPLPPEPVAVALAAAPSVAEPELVAVNLRSLLEGRAKGQCRDLDLSPLTPPLLAWETALRQRYAARPGDFRPQRLVLAHWLLAWGDAAAAQRLLATLRSELHPTVDTGGRP